MKCNFYIRNTLKDAQGVHYNSTIKRLLKTILRAIEVNAEAVGSIGVFVKDDIYSKTAEIGYWLGEPCWENGIMSKAMKEIKLYCI